MGWIDVPVNVIRGDVMEIENVHQVDEVVPDEEMEAEEDDEAWRRPRDIKELIHDCTIFLHDNTNFGLFEKCR